MAKNRKNQSAAVRFGPALRAFILCAIVGGSGVGYVWQKKQIYQLGQQIKERETRLENLRSQNRELQKHLVTLRSPRILEQRVRELNLGLVPIHPRQVWRLELPLPVVENREPMKVASGYKLELSAR